MDQTEESVSAVDEFLNDSDRVAFWDSLERDPAKRRRYNAGWLNIVDANWKRSQDKKFRLELEELELQHRMKQNRSPQGDAC